MTHACLKYLLHIRKVHQPTSGEIVFEGKPLVANSPRDSITAGIATVYQDLAMIPLMSITRHFFMGNEPTSRGEITPEELQDLIAGGQEMAQLEGSLGGTP